MQRPTSKLSSAVALFFAVSVVSVTALNSAHADPNGGTVTGAVNQAPLADRKERPVLSQGFVKRIKGPLKSPDKFDPRPNMVVVLTGGPVADEDAKPRKRSQRYVLLGESFKTDIFPYVAGSTVQIKNDGHNAPQIYAVGNDDAVDSAPINPNGEREIKAPTKPLESMTLRARNSAHLRGTVVAMPHTYYSVLSRNGSYSIAGVPPGKWTVKVWYNGGYLKLAKDVTVNVIAKKTAKAGLIRLPVELETESEASK